MKIEVVPEAAKAFNEQAEILLTEFVTAPKKPNNPRNEQPSGPDIYVPITISNKDIIGEIQLAHVDFFGVEIGKSFADGGVQFGLFDEGYKTLVTLADKFQNKIKPLRDAVSKERVKDLIFEWCELKYRKQTDSTMTEFVIEKCEGLIQELEIWIPVSMLQIQSDIVLGKVTFKTATRNLFDTWKTQEISRFPEQEEYIEKFIGQMREEMQGYAVATIKLVAEYERASEIAFEEAEKAVSLLRLFSPANFYPQLISYTALRGKQHHDFYKFFTVQNGMFVGPEEGVLDISAKPWVISNVQISEFRKLGIDILSGLLVKEKLTKFQESLVNALLLYSRSSIAKELSYKLVYILAAIESMFLRDGSEHIQSNIGERMAFLAGSTPKERMEIFRAVKNIYAVRSDFLHHGKNISMDDLEKMRIFMMTSWRCLAGLIQLSADDNMTSEKFFKMLEEKKWS